MEGFSIEDKKRFADMLRQTCEMQKGYGDTPERFEMRLRGFLWALQNYPMHIIVDAFSKYVLKNNDIPSPSDIVNIINPPPEPKEKLSGAMYVAIMKEIHAGKFLWGDKKEFVEAYEKQEMAKIRGGSEELRDAQRELENHRLMLEKYED